MPGKEVVGYCGAVGRRERTRLREEGFSPHVEGCPCCISKIKHSLFNNPRTRYPSIFLSMLQERYVSLSDAQSPDPRIFEDVRPSQSEAVEILNKDSGLVGGVKYRMDLHYGGKELP